MLELLWFETAIMSSDVRSDEASTPVNRHRHRTLEERLKAAQAIIEFEEDPHRAALEDNPTEVKVDARTWAAVFVSSIVITACVR